jgi:hypothetical protein
MSKVRSRLTFSNVVAVLALFVALGGSAYAAGKFSGKSIKPKSIPPNRIKPGSLTSTQIKDGSLKAVGSALRIKAVTYQNLTVQVNGTSVGGIATARTFSVPCTPSAKALGGGAVSSDPDNGAFVNDGGVSADGSAYTVHVFAGTATSTVTITAACVPVG